MNENNTQKVVEARAYRKIYQKFFERKVGGVVVKTPRVDPSLPNLQAVHTPYDLCHDMVSKLSEYSGSLSGKTILIFNLEFAEVMLYDEVGFGVEASQITFVTDCEEKFRYANRVQRYAGINVIQVSFNDIKKVELNMKFDVVIMNPPYQSGSNKSDPLWKRFAEKSITSLCKQNGFCCLIHPPAWRKIGHSLLSYVQNLDLLYLEMHNQVDGLKTFGAGTKYDWYVLKNCNSNVLTTVVDENGEVNNIDFKSIQVLPNFNMGIAQKVFSKDNNLSIIFSWSLYDPRKSWMNSEKTEKYSFPCVKATSAEGVKLVYSSIDKGHFGVPKVVLGKASPEHAFIDFNGEYGMTQNAFAIEIQSIEQGERIVSAVSSDKFKLFLSSTKFSGFETDYQIFSHLKKDFWKEFI